MTASQPVKILITDPALKTAVEDLTFDEEKQYEVITDDDHLPDGADVIVETTPNGYNAEMDDWGWPLHHDPATAAGMLITPLEMYDAGWDNGYKEGRRHGKVDGWHDARRECKPLHPISN